MGRDAKNRCVDVYNYLLGIQVILDFTGEVHISDNSKGVMAEVLTTKPT